MQLPLPKQKSPRCDPNHKPFEEQALNIPSRLEGLWHLYDKLGVLFEQRQARSIRSYCYYANKVAFCKNAAGDGKPLRSRRAIADPNRELLHVPRTWKGIAVPEERSA